DHIGSDEDEGEEGENPAGPQEAGERPILESTRPTASHGSGARACSNRGRRAHPLIRRARDSTASTAARPPTNRSVRRRRSRNRDAPIPRPFPTTIETAIVSPRARPSPSIVAPTIPPLANGRTAIRIVS